MAKTALFVIDIQYELAGDPSTEIPASQRIREAGTATIKAARDRIQKSLEDGQSPSVVIVFVQHEEPPNEGTLNRGTKAWELVFPPSKSSPYESLVGKTTGDAFESNSTLAAELKQSGVVNIVTFGIQSECCVLATSKGALKAGFDVTLLSGAHSTYDTKTRSAADIEKDVEEQLKSMGAKILEWTAW